MGATVALLFSPQSGETMRRLISRRAGEGHDAILDRGREIYEKGRDIADEAGKLVERGKKLAEG